MARAAGGARRERRGPGAVAEPGADAVVLVEQVHAADGLKGAVALGGQPFDLCLKLGGADLELGADPAEVVGERRQPGVGGVGGAYRLAGDLHRLQNLLLDAPLLPS